MTDRGQGPEGGRVVAAPCDAGPFTHTLLLASSPHELADAAVPFIHRALAEGDAVHVNLAEPRLGTVRSRLGSDAERVSWSDAHRWEAHPVRRLRAIHQLVDEGLGQCAGRFRFLGESGWRPDEPELRAEWERFDAALNRALEDRPLTMVCIYDPGAHSSTALARARASHPFEGIDPRSPAPEYVEPERFLAGDRPLRLAAPPGAVRLAGVVTPGNARVKLSALLSGMCDEADGVRSVDDETVDAALVATTELVTNAWQAGATTVAATCWRDGTWIVVQVDDDGSGLDDLLAGYRRPVAGAEGGRGLWITRQLADAVDVAAGAWGTSVRFRLRCAPASPAGRHGA